MVHVLGVYLNARATRAVDHRAQVGIGHTYRYVHAADRRHAREQSLDVLLGLGLGLIHLPVARYQRGAPPGHQATLAACTPDGVACTPDGVSSACTPGSGRPST